MSAILINQDDQTLIDAVATETLQVLKDGLSVDTNADATGDTPYASRVFPVKPQNVPQVGSDAETLVKEATRASNSLIALHLRPINFHFEAVSNSFAFTTSTAILSGTIPAGSRLAASRQVTIHADFSAFSSANNTSIEFWIEVDSVASSKKRFFFNAASTHSTVSSNWSLTLPARATLVELRCSRLAGAGTITLNADDSASISVWG